MEKRQLRSLSANEAVAVLVTVDPEGGSAESFPMFLKQCSIGSVAHRSGYESSCEYGPVAGLVQNCVEDMGKP